jgi:hypothetical protein
MEVFGVESELSTVFFGYGRSYGKGLQIVGNVKVGRVL